MAKRPNLKSLVSKQVPGFVRDDYQTFIAFLEAYYDYLDQQPDSDLKTLRDIDTTLDSFIKHFKNEFLQGFPTAAVDERFLIEKIKQHYFSKGSEASFKFLFRVLFNKDVTLEYPSRQVLRASDGRWNQDVSVFAYVNAGDPDMIIGRVVDVVTPTRIIRVQVDRRQYVEIEVENAIQIAPNIYEFFIDRKFFGTISVGDRMRYADVFDATILATTSKVQVQQRGKHFKLGELYEVKNGQGAGSILKVSAVDAVGAITGLEFVKYGIGYTNDFTATLLPIGGVSATSAGSTALSIGGASPNYNVDFSETTNGFFEQGTVNRADYNTDAPGVPLAWDGTYAGDIVREFFVDNKYTILDPDEPAIIKVIIGPLAKYPGYYTSNLGFLDDAIYIQDSKYYQAFSYVIKIDERLETYRSFVKSLVHPAGMALFGEYDLRNEFDLGMSLESMLRFLVFAYQDQVLMSESISAKDFGKALSDGVTIGEVEVYSMNKPLDSHLLNDNATTDDNTVTMQDTSTTLVTGKVVNSSYLNDGVTLDNNTITPTESISAKDFGKTINSSYLNDGTTLDNNSVTPTESISEKAIQKVVGTTYLNNGITLDNNAVTVTESSALTTTKYMDSAGSYPHYLNNGVTLDSDTTSATDSGGSLWLNAYTDPYPATSSYFLNDSGNYTTGESAFTG